MTEQLRINEYIDFLKKLSPIKQDEYITKLEQRKLIYLVIRILLQNQPQNRSQLDIKIILQYLKSLKFFSDIDEKICLKCSQLIKYRFFNSQENVFSRGDAGQHFYIIIDGSVGVYATVKNEQDELVEVEINQLHSGSHFGEQALIKDAPRNATIKCLTPCHLGEFDKSSYNEVLEKFALKMTKKVVFLRSLPFLCKFRPGTLQTLIQHFSVIEKTRGGILCKEGEQAKSVFIVKKGEFQIMKCLNLPRSPQTFMISEKNNQLKQLNITKSFEQIARIARGEIYGEIDCLLSEPYHFTVVCTSQIAKIYEITSNDFLQRILQHNRSNEIKEFIQHYISEKISYRNKRIMDVIHTLDNQISLLSGIHKDNSIMPYKKKNSSPNEEQKSKSRQYSSQQYYQQMVQKKQRILRQLSSKNYDLNNKKKDEDDPSYPSKIILHTKQTSYASIIDSSQSTLFITTNKQTRSSSTNNYRIHLRKIKGKLNTSVI